MNYLDELFSPERRRDEASRNRYRKALLADARLLLTIALGEPGDYISPARWRCPLHDDHEYSVHAVLHPSTGLPRIICDRGCDPGTLREEAEALRQAEWDRRHQAMVEARTARSHPRNTEQTSMVDGGGKVPADHLDRRPDIPTGYPRQQILWDQTMGGL